MDIRLLEVYHRSQRELVERCSKWGVNEGSVRQLRQRAILYLRVQSSSDMEAETKGKPRTEHNLILCHISICQFQWIY